MLGRYEYINNLTNSCKFWWLVYDKTNQQYIAYWGRIRNNETPQQTIYVGDNKALTKIKEKLKKGYELVEGYYTEEGSNAENFILDFLKKETPL